MTRGSLGAALLLLAIGCGGAEEPSEPPAPPPENGTREPPAPPPPAPPPEGDLRGDAAAGAIVYAQYCVICHGAGGRGDGPAAPSNPRPADHTDPAYMGSLSDADLYLVIEKGGAAVGKSPLMVPWGPVLRDQQIRDLIAHLRQLSGP